MQISNYYAFLSLNDERWENPDINRIFDQFKLFVIVLCDLGEGEFLSKIDKVNNLTRKNIMFISISDTLKCGFDISKYLPKNNVTNERIVFTSKAAPFDTIDIEYLARHFSVNLKDWPALVLTNDLRGTDAIVVKTSKEEISDQLVSLALKLEDCSTRISLLDLESAMQYPQSAICHCRKSIASILSDAFRRIRLHFHRDDIGALDCTVTAVEDNLHNLNSLDDSIDDAMAKRENELMDYAFNRSMQIWVSDFWRWKSGNWEAADRFFININRIKGCEPETSSSLISYNILTHYFAKLNSDVNQEDYSYDYSTLSLYLIKVFENELASSIVQQMRQALNIPMPDFYLEPYLKGEPLKFIVKTEERVVDLNMIDKTSRCWIAPTLGDMQAAYKSMVNKYPLHRFNSDFVENIWGRLIYLRKLSLHRKPANWRVFGNTHRTFCRFLDEGYFNDLVSIKQEVNSKN